MRTSLPPVCTRPNKRFWEAILEAILQAILRVVLLSFLQGSPSNSTNYPILPAILPAILQDDAVNAKLSNPRGGFIGPGVEARGQLDRSRTHRTAQLVRGNHVHIYGLCHSVRSDFLHIRTLDICTHLVAKVVLHLALDTRMHPYFIAAIGWYPSVSLQR